MKKVFFIEDDPLIIRMYERILRLNKFEFMISTNGEDGLKTLREGKFFPDIILLDIMMPHMNGLQVIEELKKDEKLSDIPIVVLTNLSAGEESRQKALDLGAELFLIKSQCSPQKIAEVVGSIIKKHKK